METRKLPVLADDSLPPSAVKRLSKGDEADMDMQSTSTDDDSDELSPVQSRSKTFRGLYRA